MRRGERNCRGRGRELERKSRGAGRVGTREGEEN